MTVLTIKKTIFNDKMTNYQMENWTSFVLTALLFKEMTSFVKSVVTSFVTSGDVTCDVTRRHVTWRHWRYHAVWRDEVVTGQIRLLVTSRHVLSIPCSAPSTLTFKYRFVKNQNRIFCSCDGRPILFIFNLSLFVQTASNAFWTSKNTPIVALRSLKPFWMSWVSLKRCSWPDFLFW